MADHLGVEAAHELVLRVEVGAEEGGGLGGCRRGGWGEAGEGLGEGGGVKVNRDAIDVVDGADDVLDAVAVLLYEGSEVGEVEGGDGLCLETDDEVDLRRVRGFEV